MKPWREMTPRERDALVADKVMNYSVFPDTFVGEDYGVTPRNGLQAVYPLEHYTTDISAAWEIVEKFRQRSHYFDIKAYASGYEATNQMVSVIVSTAPEAICLAALRAVGVEI